MSCACWNEHSRWNDAAERLQTDVLDRLGHVVCAGVSEAEAAAAAQDELSRRNRISVSLSIVQ